MTETSTLFAFDQEKERTNALFAIPKKGRLYEKCMKLLEGAGLDHNRPARLDVAHCTGMPVTLVFLPASDIATCKYAAGLPDSYLQLKYTDITVVLLESFLLHRCW
jgi:hypothetical protein